MNQMASHAFRSSDLREKLYALRRPGQHGACDNDSLAIGRAEAFSEMLQRREAEAAFLPLESVMVVTAIGSESIEITQTIELYPFDFEPVEDE